MSNSGTQSSKSSTKNWDRIELSSTDHIQVPNLEVLTAKKVSVLALLSLFSLIFALIALLASPNSSSDDVYFEQGNTFSCSRSAYMFTDAGNHDHDFEHRQSADSARDTYWDEDGLSFNPGECDPFYQRSEALEQYTTSDFADMEFYWFSRLEDVKPSMWQISIEAVLTET